MTITSDMIEEMRGRKVYDRAEEKVGKVGEVYVDNHSGEPKWITVNTGLFGTSESFVPLDGATTSAEGIHVDTDRKAVTDAPQSADGSGELTESQERDLYRHYGLTTPARADADRADADHADADRTDEALTGDDAARTTTDGDAGDAGAAAMTLSEERLSVGTESVESGRVRLRKYVVTEHQTVQVPVSHEEVRLVRETADGTVAGGEIGEDERSMTLHAERAKVGKETHAVENVRLAKETVTENESVSDEIRSEHLDVQDENGMISGGRR